jgi:hypothetical protein
MTILPIVPTISISGLNQTYSGLPLFVSTTTNPSGLPVEINYNGSASMPVNAGKYIVLATITDSNYVSTKKDTLIIQKASAVVTFSGLTQTYSGRPLSVITSTNPALILVNSTYNGSNLSPTNTGIYAVVATINDKNYFGSSTGTFTIQKASLTTKVVNSVKNFGDDNPLLTFTYMGFVTNEDESVIDQKPSVATDVTKNSLSGTYITSLSGGMDNNYDFIYINGTFTVNTVLPAVVTQTVTNTTSKSSKLSGEVSNHGGETNAIRGFCWNTSGNPTLTDSKIEVGTGLGSYSATIDKLLSNKKYYVKAYSTNTYGTSYGNEVQFTTLRINIIGVTENLIQIFPNPVRDKLTIDNLSGNIVAKIFTIEGKLILKVNLNNEIKEIKVNDLSKGIYILKLENEEMIIERRFIKE